MRWPIQLRAVVTSFLVLVSSLEIGRELGTYAADACVSDAKTGHFESDAATALVGHIYFE